MMKASARLKFLGIATLAVGLVGSMSAAIAQTFGKVEVDQSRYVLVSAPGGRLIPHSLMILQQVTDERACWSELGSNPVEITPLLLDFDFTGICSRATDSNGYSLRLADEDLGSQYRLQVTEQEGDLVLSAVPRAGRSGTFIIGRTGGISSTGFAKINLNSGWRLTKRTFEGRSLGHTYLTNDLTLAQVIEAAGGSVVTAPTPPTQPRPSITPPPTLTFADTQGDVYAADIEKAVTIGFVSGFFEDNTFRPRNPVTREQVVSMVIEALSKGIDLSLTVPAATSNPFPDVAASRWSADKILFAKNSNIVSGGDDGNFRPADPVTRAELMAILRRAIEYGRQQVQQAQPELNITSTDVKPSQDPFNFTDISGHWGEEVIKLMSSHCGIASPLNESGAAFAPNTPALRNYAASAIVRTIDCQQNPVTGG